MPRVAFCLQIKRELLEEYKERHRHVWPEMQDALRETGWRNYSLFLRDDGLLFGYVEVENFAESTAAMARTEVNARWQREMAPYFESLEGQAPDAAMVPLPEVFHLA
ncbi:L-rhamnose mutarotase [Capsulimonas corticalis]|uniref:L-rhamnose mutarotase n=1 Tax=Capsulimonas corticalis TaxID=2219043 RepID=A0A402D499_9BACT|nr:L-rhamnose mutarotase [Capsulimonas corticalis]BDI31189.1 L-rhamnose mutarotase [Capsulimonas corticalis]